MLTIRKAETADLDAVTRLFLALWPSHEEGELREEFAGLLKEEESAVFLCVADGEPVAAAQCGLCHDYVEGTSSSPVGYLEGIYVSPAYRRQGIAGKLCAACGRLEATSSPGWERDEAASAAWLTKDSMIT